MRKSRIIAYFLLSFIVGILVRSLYNIPLFVLLIIALLAIIFGFIFWPGKLENNNKKRLSILLFGSVFLFFGVLRIEAHLPAINEDHIINFNNQLVELTGRIKTEPDKREKSIHYVIDVNEINGDLLIFGSLYPEYKFGDVLKITCRLQSPQKIKNFDYLGYLAKDGIYSVCYKPQEVKKINSQFVIPSPDIHRGKLREGSLAYARKARIRGRFLDSAKASLEMTTRSWLINKKQNFKTIIDQSVNFPASSFLNSILLGLRQEIPQKIKDNFSATGTSHLMAISGLHIVILTNILYFIFKSLKISKRKSFLFVILFLIFFIGLIGFRVSAVRAGIFGLVAILSQVVSRPRQSINLLLFAAAILLLFNPLLLVFDIGFQLSFLAVLGLIYLGPFFKKLFKKIPKVLGLKDILVMTMSAQIFVLPWILYKFGNLSIIAPLANLLVLPVMPLVMGLGFGLIIIGLIFLPIAQVFGWVVWVLISYVLIVNDLLVRVPFGHFQTNLPLWGAFLLYLILAMFLYKPAREFILSKLNFIKHPKSMPNKINNQEIVTKEVDLKDYNL